MLTDNSILASAYAAIETHPALPAGERDALCRALLAMRMRGGTFVFRDAGVDLNGAQWWEVGDSDGTSRFVSRTYAVRALRDLMSGKYESLSPSMLGVAPGAKHPQQAAWQAAQRSINEIERYSGAVAHAIRSHIAQRSGCICYQPGARSPRWETT